MKRAFSPLVTRISMFAFALTLFYLAPAASAQTLRANVPFGFTVGKAAFPAGKYEFSNPTRLGLIRISSLDGSISTSIASMQSHRDNPHKSVLIFERQGDHYMLRSALSTFLGSLYADFPKPKADEKSTLRAKSEDKGEEVFVEAMVASR